MPGRSFQRGHGSVLSRAWVRRVGLEYAVRLSATGHTVVSHLLPETSISSVLRRAPHTLSKLSHSCFNSRRIMSRSSQFSGSMSQTCNGWGGVCSREEEVLKTIKWDKILMSPYADHRKRLEPCLRGGNRRQAYEFVNPRHRCHLVPQLEQSEGWCSASVLLRFRAL